MKMHHCFNKTVIFLKTTYICNDFWHRKLLFLQSGTKDFVQVLILLCMDGAGQQYTLFHLIKVCDISVFILISFQAKAVLKSTSLVQRLLTLDSQLRQEASPDASSRVNKCRMIVSNLQLAMNE